MIYRTPLFAINFISSFNASFEIALTNFYFLLMP